MSLLSNAKRPLVSSAALVTESSGGHAEGQADPADEDVLMTLGAPVETVCRVLPPFGAIRR